MLLYTILPGTENTLRVVRVPILSSLVTPVFSECMNSFTTRLLQRSSSYLSVEYLCFIMESMHCSCCFSHNFMQHCARSYLCLSHHKDMMNIIVWHFLATCFATCRSVGVHDNNTHMIHTVLCCDVIWCQFCHGYFIGQWLRDMLNHMKPKSMLHYIVIYFMQI